MKKIAEIKSRQLLGIEKLPDIYLLAVLNMILMGDGSTNILRKDSLTEFDGKYEQGEYKNKDFPADVFLLNPPYSGKKTGKGFIFVKKALARMKSGKAVVLIQENAGSGAGLPFTKDILNGYSVVEKDENGNEKTITYPGNTLLASIRMADIFKGKAGVQTAVYVFEVGKTHKPESIVRFIDMSNDGYTRGNRKKSTLLTNLRDTDHAAERYEEVVNLVLYGEKYKNYYTDAEYIEDTISLEGNDWTFNKHKKFDTTPTKEDFMKVVGDYLAWEVEQVLGGEFSAISI